MHRHIEEIRTGKEDRCTARNYVDRNRGWWKPSDGYEIVSTTKAGSNIIEETF
jgi:hypothetical protein